MVDLCNRGVNKIKEETADMVQQHHTTKVVEHKNTAIKTKNGKTTNKLNSVIADKTRGKINMTTSIADRNNV